MPTYPWGVDSISLPDGLIQTSQSHPPKGTREHPNLLSLPTCDPQPLLSLYSWAQPVGLVVSSAGWDTSKGYRSHLSSVRCQVSGHPQIWGGGGENPSLTNKVKKGRLEQFTFTSWGIFVMVALKYFSDNSNICHVGWHLLIPFSHTSWDSRVLLMLSNLAWTFVLAFSPLGCNKAAHSNQPSVDCGFSVSYVFEASGQSQIWAVVHLLVQILKMFGMLFASEHTFSEQEWVQQFTDGFMGSLPDLLTPHHLPGTCWLPLFLVLRLEPGVVFVLLCPVCQLHPCPRPNGRWTEKKRSSGELPPPSWDNSSPDWKI